MVVAALATNVAQTVQAQEADSCGVPDALRVAGETDRARKDYVALLRADPALECAKRGLTVLNAPTPDKTVQEAQALCDRGGAYRTLDRDDDALTAYKAALAKDPMLECARTGIREAGPSPAGRHLDAAARALPQYLLAAGLALVIFFFVLLFGHFGPVHARLVRVRGVGRILSPRLNVEAFSDQSDKKVGAAIEARIRERLTRMREDATRPDAPDYELDFGTPQEDFAELVAGNGGLKSALDQASEASEQTKLVAAVLNLLYTLLPIRRLTVLGVIEPPAEPRASATVSLERDGTLAAATTLMGPVSASAPAVEAYDYLKLAEPAAVWAQYEVARAIRGDEGVRPDAAESYALVREGLERQLAEDYPEAKRFYARACELDGANWAARVNLAMVEARLAQDYDAALAVLQDGFDAMRRR